MYNLGLLLLTEPFHSVLFILNTPLPQLFKMSKRNLGQCESSIPKGSSCRSVVPLYVLLSCAASRSTFIIGIIVGTGTSFANRTILPCFRSMDSTIIGSTDA